MSKHLRRPQSTRSRVAVLGAAVLAAGSVTTAAMAFGQAGGGTQGAIAKAAEVQAPRTYACPGTAIHAVRAGGSAVRLTCTDGVSQLGRTRTSASASGTTGSTLLPTGVTSGSTLVTTVLSPAASTVTMNGWTKAYDGVSGPDGLRLSAWYRTAGAGEGAPTATVQPAGRMSMITTAFSGTRAGTPVTAASAVKGFVPPVDTSAVPGARRLSAVAVRAAHLPHPRGTARTTVVLNGPTRLVQDVRATRPGSSTRNAAAAHRRGLVAVAGGLTVLPRPPAAVPAGATAVPVGRTTTATCDGTSLDLATTSATVVTVTCGGSAPTSSPTPSVTTSPTASPTASPTGSPTKPPTTSPTSTTTTTTRPPTTTMPPTTTATSPAPAPAGKVCTNPVWTTSASEGWSDGDYYVHNNMWNVGGYKVSETLAACSHSSWNVTATADNSKGDGAVKTYPNVHKDYHDWGTGKEPAWSSFKSLHSTFAAQGSGTGIYDVAYDIWMNGVPGNREIMIWTENRGQTPSGNKVGTVSVSGISWDVWATGGNGYLAFVPKAPVASGSLDLKAMIDYLVAQGRVPANSTLGQICFGVEVVSTDAKAATFRFTDFSVTSS